MEIIVILYFILKFFKIFAVFFIIGRLELFFIIILISGFFIKIIFLF